MKKYYFIILIMANFSVFSQQENNLNSNRFYFYSSTLLPKNLMLDSSNELKTNKKKDLYSSITNHGSFWAKFNYSINNAGSSNVNSIGFDIGLFPKLISFGKQKKFSLYIGGSVTSLYMLKSGNRLEQIKSFYDIQQNDQFMPMGTDTANQGFVFLGGGVMVGYKFNKVNPFLRISGGMYNIYFKGLKIYDSKQGMSTYEPNFWELGFEAETGVVLYHILGVSYKLNLLRVNQNTIDFLNKTYLFHTFSFGIMGI